MYVSNIEEVRKLKKCIKIYLTSDEVISLLQDNTFVGNKFSGSDIMIMRSSAEHVDQLNEGNM